MILGKKRFLRRRETIEVKATAFNGCIKNEEDSKVSPFNMTRFQDNNVIISFLELNK